MTRSRREFLASTAALLAGGAPFIARRLFQLFGWSTAEYSDVEIDGILGGNSQRVLRQIWTPASQSSPA